MNPFLKFLKISLFVFIFFAGCKKGEDDPLISLRSRKARFIGDWALQRGFISTNNNNTIITTIYTSSTFKTTSTLNPDLISEGTYKRTLSTNKEGTFIEEIQKDEQYLKNQGIWIFLPKSKADDLKSKESVLFKVQSQFNSNGNILNQFEGEERPMNSVRLKKLSKDEMVWTINGKFDNEVTEGEFTWILR
jgi:hypothetical protein